MQINEEFLLDECEENTVRGYRGRTIKQRYWEELYSGRSYEDFQDYYDYN